MLADDDRPRPRPTIVVGEPLDKASVEELDERVAALKAEIERVEAMRDRKGAATRAADAVFRR